jgi:AcrR family transcriptional regulator
MTRLTRKLGRPPKAEGRQTRERILEAALDLFSSRGFAGTSVREIAAAVGITEGGLYAHFAGKQAIFEELFGASGPGAVLSAIHAMADLARDQGPEAFVRALVDAVLSRWSEPLARKFMGVILRECTLEARQGAPSLSEGVGEALRQVGAAFRPWAEQGLLRSDFPPEHLAWELFAPLIQLRLMLLHPAATEKDIATAKSFGARHAEYFLSCVLTKRSARRSSPSKTLKE